MAGGQHLIVLSLKMTWVITSTIGKRHCTKARLKGEGEEKENSKAGRYW